MGQTGQGFDLIKLKNQCYNSEEQLSLYRCTQDVSEFMFQHDGDQVHNMLETIHLLAHNFAICSPNVKIKQARLGSKLVDTENSTIPQYIATPPGDLSLIMTSFVCFLTLIIHKCNVM